MPKQALLNGTLEDAIDFDGYKELDLLKESLEKNSWIIADLKTEKAGYNFIKIVNGDKEISLHVYLKKVNWRHRNDNEKGIQFPGDHITTGYDIEQTDNEKTVMIGIYKRDSFDDYLICAWQPEEWGNRGKPFNCFIDVHALAEAFRIGFTNDKTKLPRNVFAFRPEFIHYYLLNKDSLHGNIVIEENEVYESYPLSDQPLNQILYGPPGTGKTYNAINQALSIIKGNDLSGLSRKQIKMEFDAFVDSGQIQFVTFHQSYSYEEFVEGIKPIVNKKGDVEYQIVDGIFKNICKKAIGLPLLNVGDTFLNSHSSIHTISKFNNDIIEITRAEGSIITLPTELINGLIKLLNEGTIEISNIQSKEKDGKSLHEFLENKYDKYIFGYNSVLKSLIEFILSKEKINKANYVLIIDEINRGNISKIFGELITLIEDSKRIGSMESLKAKLTYSGADSDEMFGVPNNVYLVGTMNTADRSITNIDTALRRRFVFQEFSPNYDMPQIGKVNKINLKDVLKILNERIEFLLDRDHLIGHSYFIGVNDWDTLCSKFRNNIIPLLQEYFYNDWEKIALVLGDNDSWGKNDDEKFILKRKYSSETLFGRNNNLEEEFDENQYYINPKLVDKKYNELSEEFFIKGFNSTL